MTHSPVELSSHTYHCTDAVVLNALNPLQTPAAPCSFYTYVQLVQITSGLIIVLMQLFC